MDGYSYILELVDQLSGPARTAKQQVDLLTTSLAADSKELRAMQETMNALRATGGLTASVERDLTRAIDEQQRKVDGGAKAIRAMADAHSKEAAAAQKATAAEQKSSAAKAAAQAKAAKASHDAGLKMQQASGDAAGFSKTLASLGPYAAAAAAALIVLGGAVLALIVGGAHLALEASLFKNQTMAALRSTLGTEQAARNTFVEIRRISDEIGISEKKAQALGLSLLDAGVSQDALADSIKSIALLEKVRGEAVAKKLEEVIKKSAAAGAFKLEGEGLVGTGLNQGDVVAELAKKLGKSTAQIEDEMKKGKIAAADGIAAINAALSSKLGGNAKGLTGVGESVEKIYERFTRLFEDINAQPLIDALKEIGGWLDSSTSAGGALKWLFEKVFNGIFGAAKTVLPYVKVAFLELVIAALTVYIAFKPVIKQISDLQTQIFGVEGGASALTFVIKALVDALGIGLQIVAFMISLFLTLVELGVMVFQGTANAAAAAWESISTGFLAVWETLKALFSPETALETATGLIDGLVSGITGGAQRVIDALVGVGKGAIDGVKGVLGIASPSKVMSGLADNAVSSFSDTAEDGSERAQGALAAVASPPSSAGGGGGGRPSISITVAEGAIVIQAGGSGASEILELLEAKLQDMFEGIAMQLGGATEEA